jgi:hypothetical protein
VTFLEQEGWYGVGIVFAVAALGLVVSGGAGPVANPRARRYEAPRRAQPIRYRGFWIDENNLAGVWRIRHPDGFEYAPQSSLAAAKTAIDTIAED